MYFWWSFLYQITWTEKQHFIPIQPSNNWKFSDAMEEQLVTQVWLFIYSNINIFQIDINPTLFLLVNKVRNPSRRLWSQNFVKASLTSLKNNTLSVVTAASQLEESKNPPSNVEHMHHTETRKWKINFNKLYLHCIWYLLRVLTFDWQKRASQSHILEGQPDSWDLILLGGSLRSIRSSFNESNEQKPFPSLIIVKFSLPVLLPLNWGSKRLGVRNDDVLQASFILLFFRYNCH